MMATTNINHDGEGNPQVKTEINGKQRRKNKGYFQAHSSVFKGKVVEMNGHVFELPSERKKKNQFKETIEALRVFAASHYKKDVKYLEILFKDLKELTIPLPVKPQPIEQTQDDGTSKMIQPEDEKWTCIKSLSRNTLIG